MDAWTSGDAASQWNAAAERPSTACKQRTGM